MEEELLNFIQSKKKEISMKILKYQAQLEILDELEAEVILCETKNN